MKKRFLFFLIIFILIFIITLSVSAQSEIAISIKKYLFVINENNGDFPKEEKLTFHKELQEFYEQRYYQPIWLKKKQFLRNPEELIKLIKESYYEGLSPADYHLNIIKNYTANKSFLKNGSVNQKALLDILLTNAYLKLASHYLNGKINAEIIVDDNNYQHDSLEIEKLLKLLFKNDSLSKTIKSQLPKSKNYHLLKEKLYLYRDSGKIKKWPKISSEKNITLKSKGKKVKKLIDNLAARNYLDKNELEKNNHFNQNVKKALRKFQLNNGLKADGIAGKKTIKTLNISLEQRIKQLIINMERWRWLPENLGDRYIYVNIADYGLKLYDNQKLLMEMKTIVGREQRSTPVFSDLIDYLVLNPYWYVPETIAVEDILPKLKKDSNYLEKNNFSVLQYKADNKLEKIDPAKIDWKKIDKDNFDYLLRQNPGDHNSLGRIKFMFPNKFSIYLHDTPGKYLFSQSKRDFSSGCIRIEKPIDLAVYLLQDQKKWNRQEIEKEIKKDQEKIIYLKNPIKIYLQYNTAWVDEFDNLNFRNDIYNRDKKIIAEYFNS